MAWRNIQRNPRRSLLSATAIAVAALTMVLMFALINGLTHDMRGNIQRYMAGHVLISPVERKGQGIMSLSTWVADVETLGADIQQGLPGVILAPRIMRGGSVFLDGDTFLFPVMGMDMATDPMELGRFLLPGSVLPKAGAREALITRKLADKLRLAVGDRITFLTQTVRGSSNGMSLTVTGLVNPNLGQFAGSYLFTSFATAQDLVKNPGGADALLVLAPGGLTASEQEIQSLAEVTQAVVEARGNPDIDARRWDQTSTTFGLIGMMDIIYGFMGIFFFALASTVIVNTMLMVVLERSREIGTLAALGMEDGTIRRLFLAESGILSFMGALVGTLLGLGIALVLQQTGLDFSAAMTDINLEISGIMKPVVNPLASVGVLFGATAVSVLATFFPTKRIMKMRIVEALRGLA